LATSAPFWLRWLLRYMEALHVRFGFLDESQLVEFKV
jgi:hypothetical protein